MTDGHTVTIVQVVERDPWIGNVTGTHPEERDEYTGRSCMVTDGDFAVMVGRFLSIQSVTLAMARNLSAAAVRIVAGSCLEHLTIDGTNDKWDEMPDGFCWNFGEKFVAAITDGSPRLKSVRLHHWTMVTDGMLGNVAKKCGQLTSIVVDRCNALTAGLPGALTTCKNLTSLKGNWCDRLDDAALAALIRQCPTLAHTNTAVGSWWEKGDLFYREFAKLNPNLETLDLSDVESESMTCATITAVLRACPKMLPDKLVSRLKDDGFIEVAARQHPSLKSLDLRGYSGDHGGHVTDTGLATIAHGFPELQQLDLSHCQVTDDGLALLRNLPLESLRLRGCKTVTDTGLATIAHGFPELQQLDLSHCQVTDDGLAVLRNLPLKSLRLRGCQTVTDTSIATLAAGCPELTKLDVTDCDLYGVTYKDLLSLLLGHSKILPGNFRCSFYLQHDVQRAFIAAAMASRCAVCNCADCAAGDDHCAGCQRPVCSDCSDGLAVPDEMPDVHSVLANSPFATSDPYCPGCTTMHFDTMRDPEECPLCGSVKDVVDMVGCGECNVLCCKLCANKSASARPGAVHDHDAPFRLSDMSARSKAGDNDARCTLPPCSACGREDAE